MGEFDHLFEIEQDPSFPRVRVPRDFNDFTPNIKCASPPTDAELLLQQVTGESTSEFNSRIQKSVGYKESLDTVETLTKAVDAGLAGELVPSADILRKSASASPLMTERNTGRNRHGGNPWLAIAADRARSKKAGQLAAWQRETGLK
jgi:hypothetical protein